MKRLFLTLLLAGLLGANAVRGQGAGAPVGWFKGSRDAPLCARWSLCTEVETRQGNAQLAGQQLGRLGLRLHVAPCLSLTTGYVFAANDGPAGYGPDTPEHRLYQEVVLTDVAGPVRSGHRLRAEERWLRPTPEAGYVFAPRLRYQLRLVVPPPSCLPAWAARKAAACWKKTASAPAWATASAAAPPWSWPTCTKPRPRATPARAWPATPCKGSWPSPRPATAHWRGFDAALDEE